MSKALLSSLVACLWACPAPVTLQVSLQEGCFTPELECAGQLAVFAIDSQTDAVVQARCVPFGEQAHRSVQELLVELAPDVDLTGSRQLRLEVALREQSSAGGCDRAFPGKTYYSGSSATLALSQGAVLPLTLACHELPRCKRCDRFASPTGSDSGAGSQESPLRSVSALLGALQPGETGCLLSGVYTEPAIPISRGGEPGAPLRLTSAPGHSATVKGRIAIRDSANHLVFSDLTLDGDNPGVSPHVFGDHIVFRQNVILNSGGGGCLYLGDSDPGGNGRAVAAVIEGNRIPGCGPDTNGIGLQGTDGVRVAHNFIYGNTKYGVQLYADADDSVVEHNVIDNNLRAIHLGGGSGRASDRNRVRNNLLTHSTDVNVGTAWFGGVEGTGNEVRGNCIFGGTAGNLGPQVGFSATDNLEIDPQYANRTTGDFAVPPGNACEGKLPLLPPP